eukprot:gene28937-50842_t
MLETIGEIAASQSMINHMLGDLAETDLTEDLDAVMRNAGNDWSAAKTELHSLMTAFSARLRAVSQLEAQLVGRMTQLQEETVAIRSRPVESVLRPLAAFVAQVQMLRGQFSASHIVGLNVGVDFESQQQALSAGCDACFATGTQHAAIMARIVKLCSNEEEPPYRVLVVEDSKTAGAMIRRTLSEAGMQSLAITRPQDVLTALASFQPDLVLMDMYMPGCTGVEVTRVIRQHAEFLSTPVVYLSGDSNVALQVDALRLG